MADNANLGAAKNAKNDEFYTQYSDIEAEMNAYVEYDPDVFRGKTVLLPCDDPEWSNFTKYFASNFERFGLKKLISTSYAKGAGNKQLSLFEEQSPLYDAEKHDTHGKLFVLTRDKDGSGNIDTDDIEFSGYLEGDGDFRSPEVCALRDEADIIITNPPFSLFREFLAWIIEAKKQFAIIGNQNAITYKEVFPLLKDNLMWLGYSIHSGDRKFNVPDDYPLEAATCGFDPDGRKFIRVKGVRWFTNIDHGQRHEPLLLDTMAHNLKYNKKLKKKLETEYGSATYPRYDNYDAIEVPFTECIPSDYLPCWYNCPNAASCQWAAKEGKDPEAVAVCDDACTGNMGVPITFLDKHNPEQFEVVGADYELANPVGLADGRTGTGRFYIKKGLDKPDSISDNQLSSAQLSSAQLSSAQLSSAQLSSAQLSSGSMRGSSSVARCNGIMGVPITFLDKYNPDQFEIVGGSMDYEHTDCHIMKNYVALGYGFFKSNGGKSDSGALKDKMSPKVPAKGKGDYSVSPSGEYLSAVYGRIFIHHKKGGNIG